MGVDGYFYNETEKQETVVATKSVTARVDGKFEVDFGSQAGGEYLIRAKYSGAQKTAYTSETYSYVESDEYISWNTGNNSVTELIAESSIVKPGETAKFTLKSPVSSGKVFISLVKDDAVLDAYSMDITGYAMQIEVPITVRHIPNLYVRAFVIGMDTGKGLPVYKRALAGVKVLPDSQTLNVQVKAQKPKYSPGESLKVDIEVKDATGAPVQNANGSLSVVDQSVLALLGNPLRNPFAFFYDMKRYLGTTVYVSLMNLVEKLEVKNT